MAISDFQDTVKGAVKTYLDLMAVRPVGEEIQYRTQLENFINDITPPHRNLSVIQETVRFLRYLFPVPCVRTHAFPP
jgi:hypothetical protein